MNKKSLLGLILFAGLVIIALFIGADYMAGQDNQVGTDLNQSYTKDENTKDNTIDKTTDEPTDNTTEEVDSKESEATVSMVNIQSDEPWLSTNPTDQGNSMAKESSQEDTTVTADKAEEASEDTFSTSMDTDEMAELICDSSEVDYKAYIPDMIYDSELEVALDISNPSIEVDAEAAILLDASTNEVLYYKNPVQAMFPASTAKLLTSLVALQWCDAEEEVTIGDEITMIASDSTRAYLCEGQVLTISNLLAGMLLPSGNDSAYAVAAYVGKKSLDNADATKEEAVAEFIRLMNKEAKKLGVKNSCFKTPDGYDAVGQYTTAYDMGLIGVAAANNDEITNISRQSSSRNIFVSGEDVTWKNTNKLITKYSGQYYSKAIGLKTGTSSMAGRCMIAAAEYEGKRVVCVIMDSTIEGRWEDAISLLKYGLE